MIKYILFFLLISASQLQSHIAAQIIAPGAKLTLIDSGFAFTEGPATDKDGNIFFTDQPRDNIWKYDTSGKLSLFMHGAKRSNGMYFNAAGNLVSCADEYNQLISITPDKNITVLINNFQNHVLNGPNDVWINRLTGDIYFTDPYYERDYWKRNKPDSVSGEKLYCLLHTTKQLTIADSSVKKPNGIVGTPDGKHLYVADMGEWKTYRYNIEPDGTLTNKQLFTNEASDGMTIDNAGNIYLTGKGVNIYDSSGKKIEHINVPEIWTANICFGGKNKDELFITASKSVYIIHTLVKGVE